ncbi:hypothetical protein V6N11_007255 [Hibiscus sabdariffa]|uniref:Uncharacterized protein n=1 Tax=Hibiscus sabdariffa TaxID=183260 RepID=A0ABR2RTJ6_9ROSI
MQRSWKLNIEARSRIFNLKLKATNILPTGDFHRFSLLLRLRSFILKLHLKSDSTLSISTQRKRTFKSTFLTLLHKLRLRRANNALTTQNPDLKSLLKQFATKESGCGGSLVIAIMALLLQWISKEDGKHYVSNYAWKWIEWSYGYSVFSGFWYAAWKLKFEEQEELKSYFGLVKEPRSPSPQPLPLPFPPRTVLKIMGSFESGNVSHPLFASGPLPLPPCGTLGNFAYEEIATACHHFSSDN